MKMEVYSGERRSRIKLFDLKKITIFFVQVFNSISLQNKFFYLVSQK
jgi:hypothetical protein